jgi:hypothetical protein
VLKFALLIGLGVIQTLFSETSFSNQKAGYFVQCGIPAAGFDVTIVLSNRWIWPTVGCGQFNLLGKTGYLRSQVGEHVGDTRGRGP